MGNAFNDLIPVGQVVSEEKIFECVPPWCPMLN
jgi:hypothetical protein